MHTLTYSPRKISFAQMVSIVFVFSTAIAITSPAQTLTTLVSFDGSNGGNPISPVIQGTDGNFYGVTPFGGTNDDSTVFTITPSGTLTTLHNFDGADGRVAVGGLVQGTDGLFYGTTAHGGANGDGTVFTITPSGTLTTLHNFDNTDGYEPFYGGLVQASDGNFYGTTTQGGAYSSPYCSGCGTVFRITPSGTLTTLYSFCSQPNCVDGAFPQAGLVQGSDGNFYGTTFGGGANGNCAGGCGTVFKITPIGALTTLYSFCSQPNCADGDEPLTTLVQGTDGNFYGETQLGGAYCPPNGCGTVFKITSSGTLTTLHSFNGADGCCIPDNPLLQATDGNFYGTSASGGANGTVFEMTPSGTLTTLYSFEGADGENPYAGLVQAVDGSFYGTTSNGGSGGGGTVFRFALPVQLVPVTPCRVVDTRGPTGIFGGPPIQGGAYRSFPIPQSACNISANAAAYSLNVTVVPHGALGYLTIWPTGDSQPYVSTMNSPDGRIKANAAIVPKGANGAVSVYATDTTDVILDIDGYFAPPASEYISVLSADALPHRGHSRRRWRNAPAGRRT